MSHNSAETYVMLFNAFNSNNNYHKIQKINPSMYKPPKLVMQKTLH